jgi:hypothetical protein
VSVNDDVFSRCGLSGVVLAEGGGGVCARMQLHLC